MLNKLKSLRNSKEEGFSLVELLVVIIIIGVVAAIAVPIFSSQQEESIKAGVKSDARTLASVTATYFVKNPTATGMGFLRQGSKTAGGTLAGDPLFQGVKASHPETYLKLRGMTSSAANVNGAAWNGYVVMAYNDTMNDKRHLYSYNSQTGRFTESIQYIPEE